MDILVIGVGYVGLVTGACFAEMGHHVICLDINQEKVNALEKGIIPIYEPGLEEIVKRNVKAGRLTFTTDYASSVGHSTVCFIAVDTPISQNGLPNTQNVENVAAHIGKHMQKYMVVVTKSTVPVGTTERVGEIIAETLQARNTNLSFDVVSNPEFLKEGNAIHDFMKPDRVIIGVNNPQVIPFMKEIYSPFMLNHERLLVMDIPSAELAKYVANGMLATRISFMNEVAGLCEKVGANIDFIRRAIGSDQRIGPNFLYAGVGYGGSCLPKDIRGLEAQARLVDYAMPLMHAVDAVNTRQKQSMAQKVIHYYSSQGSLRNKVIGVLGLAFKPDTDDMREASSLMLISELLKHGTILRVFDPVAMDKAKAILYDQPCIIWCQNEMEVADGADALVLMTEWKQFRFMNFETILSKMNGNVFFDGRNQYLPEEMMRRGFHYISIGRPTVNAENSLELERIANASE